MIDKEFIKQNRNLFLKNDFTSFFRKVANSSEYFEFFYNTCGVNPLEYIKSASGNLLNGINLNDLYIPETVKISSQALKQVGFISTVMIKAEGSFDVPANVSKVIFDNGITRLSGVTISASEVVLPASCTSIGAKVFNQDTVKTITTPYRENAEDKIRLPELEISWFREHLKFTH